MRLYLLTNLPVRSPSDDLTGCLGDDSKTVLAGSDFETVCSGKTGTGNCNVRTSVYTPRCRLY